MAVRFYMPELGDVDTPPGVEHAIPMPDARIAAIRRINAERERQLELWGDRSISGALQLDTKLRILVEEVGEVAKAIDDYQRDPSPAHYAALVTELIQVGACALGFLEGT